MEVQTLSMDPRIARIYYRDYHEKVLKHRRERLEKAKKEILEAGRALRQARTKKSQVEKEDEQLMHSFRAMARGERIINISSVIPKAGLQEKTKLPALAIANADWKFCFLHHQDDHIVFSNESGISWSWKAQRYTSPTIWLPRRLFPAELTNSHWRAQNNLPEVSRSRALVPAIPAHLRPDNLDDYCILWEPVWEAAAPEDPLLLKHINGPIYTVVAQWDLTPLERSILEGRLG